MDYLQTPIALEVRKALQVAQKVIPTLGFFVEEPTSLTPLYIAADQIGGKLVALEECHLLDVVQGDFMAKVVRDTFAN